MQEVWKDIEGYEGYYQVSNCRTYDEISEILGIAKGTVHNYIRQFKIKKIYL